MDKAELLALLKSQRFWKVTIIGLIILVLVIMVIVYATKANSLQAELDRLTNPNPETPAKPESFKGRCKRCQAKKD